MQSSALVILDLHICLVGLLQVSCRARPREAWQSVRRQPCDLRTSSEPCLLLAGLGFSRGWGRGGSRWKLGLRTPFFSLLLFGSMVAPSRVKPTLRPLLPPGLAHPSAAGRRLCSHDSGAAWKGFSALGGSHGQGCQGPGQPGLLCQGHPKASGRVHGAQHEWSGVRTCSRSSAYREA